jgi:predicted phosphodiesterase
MFREAFGDKPILAVQGNHDFWEYESFHPDCRYSQYNKKEITYEFMKERHKEWMEKYSIHYLSDKFFEKDNVIFLGYDGYYNEIPPRSNDYKFMPKEAMGVPIHQYLNKKAHDQLEEILFEGSKFKKEGKKIVCCTHFNLIQDYGWEHMSGNPHYLQSLCNVPFDLILWGHNHKREDIKIGETRICNAGGDYDIPKAMLVEI